MDVNEEISDDEQTWGPTLESVKGSQYFPPVSVIRLEVTALGNCQQGEKVGLGRSTMQWSRKRAWVEVTNCEQCEVKLQVTHAAVTFWAASNQRL